MNEKNNIHKKLTTLTQTITKNSEERDQLIALAVNEKLLTVTAVAEATNLNKKTVASRAVKYREHNPLQAGYLQRRLQETHRPVYK